MDFSFINIFVWLLAAFYGIAGLAPLLNWEKTSQQYQQWGFPSWFGLVTAIFEVAVGVFLILPQTRMAGAALGCAIMVAAIATLFRCKEYSHAVPPTIVLSVTLAMMLF